MQDSDSSSDWKLDKQIDSICDSYEADLHAGRARPISELLPKISEAGHDRLLFELLLLKWDYDDANGTAWSFDAYRAEFSDRSGVVERASREFQGRQQGQVQETTDTNLQAEEDTDVLLAAQLRPGSKVGQYLLEDEIGTGGVGVVFRARQISTDRPVAIKFPNLPRCTARKRAELRDRFLQEPKAVARLDYDHIVTVFEASEHEGLPFFSMQLIEGPSLRSLTKDGPIDCRVAAQYMRDIAGAIHHAHQHKVLHRDLKPGNVLIGPDSRPFVTDFGMAKLLVDDVELTRAGTGLGTVGYVSPEQAEDASSADERSDVYGLGSTLYCLLTGRPPFQGATQEETLRQVQMMDPVPPRQLNPQVDRDLQTVCLKCLAKNPAHRYNSAAELQEDLTRYLGGSPVRARPVGALSQTWRWLRRRPALTTALILAICLALLLAIGGPMWAYQQASSTASLRAALNERDAQIVRATIDEAQLEIQVGQWASALTKCESVLAMPGVDDRAEVVLLASDALAAMGSTNRRKRLLAGIEHAQLNSGQLNRYRFDMADIARLEGDQEAYDQFLAQLEPNDLPPADLSYLQALQTKSLEARITHLQAALLEYPWHFEAFTELLATYLLLDKLDDLDSLTSNSNLVYSQDPSTALARALAAAARHENSKVQQFLEQCRLAWPEQDFETAAALLGLISAARSVELPWQDQLRNFQLEVDGHLETLKAVAEGPLSIDQLSSRLLRLLPQIIVDRFYTSAPSGIVQRGEFFQPGDSEETQVAKLQKIAEEQPDAMTYCILAEMLSAAGDQAAAADAAGKAIDAPTLYPLVRRYACSFAGALWAYRVFEARGPDEKKMVLKQGGELVKRRLQLGPVTNLLTGQPLAEIAIANRDWDLLQNLVIELRVHHPDHPEVIRLEMIAAYHHQNYLKAMDLARRCEQVMSKDLEKRRARNIYRLSKEQVEERIAESASLALPENEGSPEQ